MKTHRPFYLIRRFLCFTLAGLIIANPSYAKETKSNALIVSGQALIIDGDIETALLRAVLDALRTAATQQKGQFTSFSSLNAQGQLAENITLKADLNIHHVSLIEEWADDEIARVKLALELSEAQQSCQLPQLTQIVTTHLETPTANKGYHQVDINQLLLNAEKQFAKLAKTVNFDTHQANPTLSEYQQAWLASQAYNQADYHLNISVQWASKSNFNLSLDAIKKLVGKPMSQANMPTALIMTATFKSLYSAHLDLKYQQEFMLAPRRSLSESSQFIPKEQSQQLVTWIKKTWKHIYQHVQCEGSYIKLTKIIDQPLWLINKGQVLGITKGQHLLLLPKNYQSGILNPDAKSAPQVFKVTLLQPHAAVLEHIAGPKNIIATTAKVILF